MKKAGIIGFGRFGQLLAELSKGKFDAHIVELNSERAQQAAAGGFKLINFESLSDMDYIFLAVPISNIEEVLINLAPIVNKDQIVVDLCSVKVYPSKLMKKHLKTCQILASHPMFGPDSAKKGLDGLQVAVCPIRIEPENLKVIIDFWSSYGATVLETTPEEHDQDVAYSQALTYTVAKIINDIKIPDITFRTTSFNAITEAAALSANDSEQLFHDMLFYNPYFLDMKRELEGSIKTNEAILSDIEAEQS